MIIVKQVKAYPLYVPTLHAMVIQTNGGYRKLVARYVCDFLLDVKKTNPKYQRDSGLY